MKEQIIANLVSRIGELEPTQASIVSLRRNGIVAAESHVQGRQRRNIREIDLDVEAISVTGPRTDTGAALHGYIKNLENVKVGWTLGTKSIAVSQVVGRAPPEILGEDRQTQGKVEYARRRWRDFTSFPPAPHLGSSAFYLCD